MKINRLRYIPAALILVLTWASCSSPEKKQERPNILMIMSDNQSWNHVGSYGDKIVRTPNMDRIAAEGVRFTNAFCSSPSCTPARAAMLTGQDIWRLNEGANLWGVLPVQYKVYPDLLEESGYQIGFQGKGWGPGSFEANKRPRNPAGNKFGSFAEFLKGKKEGPWCYWVSSLHPHRPYVEGSGEKAGIDPNKVTVPGYLPDHISIRKDIADYYAAIETFDRELGETIAQLKASGELENTVIVVCSDNGWQMPRGLANLYDFGTHVPLIISWPGKFKQGVVADNMVTLNDLAPTFLELGKTKVPAEMTGKSLLPVVENGKEEKSRDFVVLGRERHAFVRQHGLGYPGRAIRTKDYLYIKNYEPNRWPAGDPPFYGDIDPYMFNWPGETKYYLIEHKNDPKVKPLFELSMGKRAAEELFDIHKDPDQLHNLAALPEYQKVKQELAAKMRNYLIETKDPRETNGNSKVWDTADYFSEVDKTPKPSKEMQKRFKLDSAYNYLK
ncbi:sulfatase family protein [Pedobacter africanus]|uniref:Arylsulfatase A-like enzyme n=1 Tax=Pedobacter africanus TaxID=151894 RepID=A0ACC6KQL9_9SPHI|nr:sulfatase [Pedobacter africanus]MDR6781512.1 arylsulfatase A-like enzyme [Pedobacter africanus]